MRTILNLLLLTVLAIPAWAADPAPAPGPDAAKAAAPAAPAPGKPVAAASSVDPDLSKVEKKKKADEDPGLIGYYNQGGSVMHPILALGVIALIVCVERLMNMTRGNIVPPGLRQRLVSLFRNGQEEEMRTAARKNGSSLAKVALFCLENKAEPYDVVTQGASDLASRELKAHFNKTYWLAVVSTVAPLLGLFGTVVGMVISFQKVAVAGDIGDISTVAGGIAIALITTVGGLVVAIPALLMYHLFKSKLNKFSGVMEDECSAMLLDFFGKKGA